MFSLQVVNDAVHLESLVAAVKDVPSRLEARLVSSPAEYTAILNAKEVSYNQGTLHIRALAYSRRALWFCLFHFKIAINLNIISLLQPRTNPFPRWMLYLRERII